MLRYRLAFYLPRTPGGMVVAEALDFPGAMTQGFDLADATPNPDSAAPDADPIELIPLSVHAGSPRA